MRFIGITGGVGAGKSAILSYLARKPHTRVMLADEIAHELMEPGTECYLEIVEEFQGEDIFIESEYAEGQELTSTTESLAVHSTGHAQSVCATACTELRPFDRQKLAQVIFADEVKRHRMNAIVHPAVKAYVKQQYELERQKGELELLVLEAALLIEEDYGAICDELWYIDTSEANRRKRLVESRGYSHEKIDAILRSQLTEEEFREGTKVAIDNNGTLEETFRQIEDALRREDYE